jgi:hypothetical protein
MLSSAYDGLLITSEIYTMPRAKKTSIQNSVQVIPAKSGHGWTMIMNGEKPASTHRGFTFGSKREAIKAAVNTFHDKGENVKVMLRERDGTVHDLTGFAQQEVARASTRPVTRRKVLFPITPSATGNEAIRKAVQEVIQELGE